LIPAQCLSEEELKAGFEVGVGTEAEGELGEGEAEGEPLFQLPAAEAS
jgi:hypothetical protein